MKFTKKEIVYLDPLHTAKTLVLVYLCFSVPIVLLALFVAFVRDGSIPGFTVVSALILNALLGFGLLWIAAKSTTGWPTSLAALSSPCVIYLTKSKPSKLVFLQLY